jgi:hypothetical protein
MAKLSDFTPDKGNANKGTQRGLKALDTSLRQYGAGRSILVDKKGRVIAGNKTLERAADIGIDDVIVVESDGTKLIAVKRTDLDLESDDGKARALATYDNRVGQLDLDWDIEALQSVDSDVLKDLWTDGEIMMMEFHEDDMVDSFTNEISKMAGDLSSVTLVFTIDEASRFRDAIKRDGMRSWCDKIMEILNA